MTSARMSSSEMFAADPPLVRPFVVSCTMWAPTSMAPSPGGAQVAFSDPSVAHTIVLNIDCLVSNCLQVKRARSRTGGQSGHATDVSVVCTRVAFETGRLCSSGSARRALRRQQRDRSSPYGLACVALADQMQQPPAAIARTAINVRI